MSRIHQISRSLRLTGTGVVAAALIPVASLSAQTSGPPDSLARQQGAAPADTVPKFGAILGTVFDSVHAQPLANAAVLVEGSTRMGFTNDRGAFVIDSVPPGNYRVRVEHAVLDTLGIQMLTDPFQLAATARHVMELAVPSSETIVVLSCPAAVRRLGPGAIVGRVIDADTDTPVPQVRVSYAWQQLSLTGTSVRMEPRLRSATTGGDGVFRICGLPNDVEGTLQAERGPIKTAEVKLAFEGRTLVVQGMRIGNAETVARVSTDSADQAAATTSRFSQPTLQRGQAVLTGKVVGANGQPIVGARVEVVGAISTALTGQTGEFQLRELPSGTQVVRARQIGFAPVEETVNLSTRAPSAVTITLSEPAQVLERVVVEAEADRGLERIGFHQRKRALTGYFLTSEDIMQRAPNMLTDVFRTIPSLRVVRDGLYDYKVESARATLIGPNCVRFFFDGVAYRQIYPGDIDRMTHPSQVGAIEVYDGTSAPIEFQVAGASSCATIVVWSKFEVERRNRRGR